MKVPRKSRRQPDRLRLTCARVRPPIREQGTGKGTGSMEQGINSPPIPTPLNAHRSNSPMDGQPQACKCQCHQHGTRCLACCDGPRPIDHQQDEAPVDYAPPDRRWQVLVDGVSLHMDEFELAGFVPALPRAHQPYPSQMTAAERQRGLARLRFAVAWCGPWERLEAWLLGIDAGSLDLRRVIREHSLREAVAVWCGSRDLRWQRRHVESGRSPARRWARKAAR